MVDTSGTFDKLRLSQLEVSEDNVRNRDLDTGLDELMNSMAQYGLQQPLVVQARGGVYEILIGQRRYFAAKELGWPDIDVKILTNTLDKLDATVLSFSENAQRRDLGVKDKADACSYLYDQLGSVAEVAKRLGFSQKTVRKWLGVSRLPDRMQELIQAGSLTVGMAQSIIVSFDDANDAIAMAETVSSRRPASDEQKRITEVLDEAPNQAPEEVIKKARENRVRKEITFILPPQWQTRLEQVAKEREVDTATIAKDATIEWLAGRFGSEPEEAEEEL